MDKKTGGIIGLVAAIFFCGLPGLCSLCMGPLFALVSFFPDANIDIFGSNEPGSALGIGIAILCGGVIFVAIPVLVWYFFVREKPVEENVIDYEGQMPEDF
jgi:TM2 domain-containing membrane protein YozV